LALRWQFVARAAKIKLGNATPFLRKNAMFCWMKALKRAILILCLAGSLGLLAPTDALAQRKGKNDHLLEEEAGKSYVLPYALVTLGIVLGLLMVARPGTREDKVKVRAADEDEDLEA
jgi:hypothetical protein